MPSVCCDLYQRKQSWFFYALTHGKSIWITTLYLSLEIRRHFSRALPSPQLNPSGKPLGRLAVPGFFYTFFFFTVFFQRTWAEFRCWLTSYQTLSHHLCSIKACKSMQCTRQGGIIYWYNWPRSRYHPCSHLGEVRGWWTVCFRVAVRDGGEVIKKQRHCDNCEVRKRTYNPLWILSHTFMPSS